MIVLGRGLKIVNHEPPINPLRGNIFHQWQIQDVHNRPSPTVNVCCGQRDVRSVLKPARPTLGLGHSDVRLRESRVSPNLHDVPVPVRPSSDFPFAAAATARTFDRRVSVRTGGRSDGGGGGEGGNAKKY